jgi:hypothetical protein
MNKSLVDIISLESAKVKGEQRFSDATLSLINEATKTKVTDAMPEIGDDGSAQGISTSSAQRPVSESDISIRRGGFGAPGFDYRPDRLYPQEYFPTENPTGPIASYGGSIVGNVPIFAPGAIRFPYSIVDRRARNIAEAEDRKQKRFDDFRTTLIARGATQYNEKLNQMLFDRFETFIEEYDDPRDAVDEILGFRTDKSRAVWKDITGIQFFAEDSIVLNNIAASIAEEAAVADEKYVPDDVADAAQKYLSGSIDIEYMYENKDKYAEYRDKLRQHTNLMSKIEGLKPILTREMVKISENGTFFKPGVTQGDVDMWTKAAETSYEALLQTGFMEYVSDDAIKSLASMVKTSGSFVQDEATIADYLRGLFGTGQLTIDKVVLDKYRPSSATNVTVNNGGNDPVERAPTIYGNVAYSVRDKDGIGVMQVFDDALAAIDSLPDDATDQDITQSLNQAIPDVSAWSFEPVTGVLTGKTDIDPAILQDKIATINLEQNKSRYQVQVDGGWVSLQDYADGINNDPANAMYLSVKSTGNKEVSRDEMLSDIVGVGLAPYFDFDANGKVIPKSDIELTPNQANIGLLNNGKLLTRDQLLAGVLGQDVTSASVMEYYPVEEYNAGTDENPNLRIRAASKASPIRIIYDLNTSFGMTSADNAIKDLQDYNSQNRTSRTKSGATVNSPLKPAVAGQPGTTKGTILQQR